MKKIELIAILSFYYYDYKKNNRTAIETFTKNYNQYFNSDYSSSTILFELGKFKKIDPANNDSADIDDVYYSIWNQYVTNEKLDDLKSIYKDIKTSKYINRNLIDIDSTLSSDETITSHIGIFIDKPEPVPSELTIMGINAYPRSKEVVGNALNAAEFTCENLECQTKLFKRKTKDIYYTEAHHLVPLSFQNDFDVSLDVEANVVSLCPNCHCMLHYSNCPDELLKELFEKRRERLNKVGIVISFEELLLMYR